MKYNTVVIGGGAAGMCAAILIKRQLKNAEVLIVETLDRVCKKLIVTGNGRCNITNKYLQLSSYHGENVNFCHNALTKYGYDFTEAFFESIGVPFYEGVDGKMYPFSLQASSVVDALRLEAQRLGVKTENGILVDKIIPQSSGFSVVHKNGEFICENVIVATGGMAGGDKLGCFGAGYKMLKELGFSFIPTTSSIVQLVTDTENIKAINGLKIDAEVSSFVDDKKIRTERGELLFTAFGISGPPVLQISRFAEKLKGNKTVKINMLPDLSYNDVISLLKSRSEALKDRTAEFFFTGLFPKMIGHTLLKISGIRLTTPVADFTDRDIRSLAESINKFTLTIFGTKGLLNAQVTAGGISTKDFDDTTMESKKYKGLYAVGEVLDIDGDCGGFNLQWAWSSAACAAEGIVKKYI
ncbi:MAG: aminoacetone oxidase family FAD-binding enzyme [Acutalibacteraceae bacterium]|nr:aminoacetone oxidase family FAD-binding enzyme [Acutalibacteraceae bacterium]